MFFLFQNCHVLLTLLVSCNVNVARLCDVRTGVVTLLKDYEVCKQGDVLTPEQTRILVSSGLFNSLTENRGHVSSFTLCGSDALLHVTYSHSPEQQHHNWIGIIGIILLNLILWQEKRNNSYINTKIMCTKQKMILCLEFADALLFYLGWLFIYMLLGLNQI